MEQSKNQKVKMCIIRSLNMCNFLANRGYRILNCEDSEINPKFKVFFFEESPELHETMAMFDKEA